MAIRTLLIGTGRFGKNHLRNLAQLVGPENLYVADLDVGAARRQGAPPGGPAGHGQAGDHAQLAQVDALDIGAPTQSHHAIAVDCIAAGKDVFAEKPLTETSAQALDLLERADAAGIILQPGHIFRYNPATRFIKEHIDAGNLGAPMIFRGSFGGFKRPRTDVGVAWTDGIHFYDLAAHFFGARPESVQAVGREFLERGGLEDWACVILNFPGGRVAQVNTEYYYPEKSREVVVVGERACVRADVVAQKVELYKRRHVLKDGVWGTSETQAVLPEIITQEPLSLELRAFLDSVASRVPPLATPQAAYDLACIVEAMYESMRAGAATPVRYGN